MPRLTIDAREVEVPDGATILEAAGRAGVAIPTLCSDPRLTPSGACRLCVVEVAGHGRPVASCTALAADGMVVTTATPQLVDTRRTLLEMVTEGYPAGLDAEPLRQLLVEHGVELGPGRLPNPDDVDDSHPLIHVDLSRCVSCWRCVRICEEVQGQFVWRIEGRGSDSHVVAGTDGAGLGTSACVACGACVDTCPSGALVDRPRLGLGAVTSWTRTVCPYCGVGCELEVGHDGSRIAAVRPAVDAPANRGHACVKGRYGFGFLTAADRITSPMIRDADGWRAVSWEQALETAASGLRAAAARGGPNAVGVLGSARATNEENYVIQKFARTVLGTNNVDSCARVCHAPSAAALKAMFGTGASTSSYADIELAHTILVAGANVTENHPVVGARIKQAALHGAQLIVIDPREIELAQHAAIHLRPRPGTNVALFNAMAATILHEGLIDAAFVSERVDGLDAFREFLDPDEPDRASRVCGVEASAIRDAARLFATAAPSICFHGLGLTEHHQGTAGVMALANLVLLTGSVGRPGTGMNPLRGQNNVQGAAHMGCEPAHLPGYTTVAEDRKRVSEIWNAPIPEDPGLDAIEMIEAARRGDLRALYVVGWDVMMTNPDSHRTGQGLAALDTVVVQDLFLNETARASGTVFLPAAASFEKDGTFMSSERRVQRVRAATRPPGLARADWEIVSELARAYGKGALFPYRDAREIWAEIRRVWLPGAGIGDQELDEPGGRQWPCPADGHPGTPRLHAGRFATATGRAGLRCIQYEPPLDPLDDAHPLVLVTGRTLAAFNAGTMTARSALQVLRPTDRLEINQDDAEDLGIADGELARVTSRYGEVVLAVDVGARVPRGVAFATFHDPAAAVNRVTSDHRDPVTHTPAYKYTAVRVGPA